MDKINFELGVAIISVLFLIKSNTLFYKFKSGKDVSADFSAMFFALCTVCVAVMVLLIAPTTFSTLVAAAAFASSIFVFVAAFLVKESKYTVASVVYYVFMATYLIEIAT